MTRTEHSAVPTHATARERGVDLARGVALVSMFVAHTAPSGGPGGVLQLSEYLTFPLFAVLVGVGAELAARRTTAPAQLVGTGVRAGALVLLGWLLAQAGAQVVVVLAPLGVLTLLCWGLGRAPSWAVTVVGATAWAVAPWTVEVTAGARVRWVLEGSEARTWLLDLVASVYYPQALLLACAAAGVLLARWLFPRTGAACRPSTAVLGGVVLALAVLGAAVLALDVTGRVVLVAYGNTHLVNSFVVVLAALALCGSVLAARSRAAGLLSPVARAGAMTLTVYVAQVCWLAAWARVLHPGEPDDSWANVVGMTLAALVLADLWGRLRLPGPWSRGPLEGAVGSIVALFSPEPSRPPDGRPAEGSAPASVPLSGPNRCP